jgi:hypothetical protein
LSKQPLSFHLLRSSPCSKMLSKYKIGFVSLTIFSASQGVLGRIRWLERDNNAIFLHPRRFGQEHPAVIDQIAAACPGAVCGTLSGQAITPLLAAQPECSQQDFADTIIDAAAQFDDATKQNMIQLAIVYRQAEKNTPPDFTTNPPTNRNSVFCQKAPKNAQLNGLVQAQDPANDPNTFFDPATKASVKKGDQPNTFPFGTSGSATNAAIATPPAVDSNSGASNGSSTDCASAVTVTVTGSAAVQTSASTVTVGAGSASSSNIGNFGSCSVPQIEFGVGFDGRKETSFQPADKASFNHGSAQNIDIISKFICDTLTNSCGADQTAKDTCAQAQTAADGQTAKTGAQADAFNAVFGITTNFAAVASVDDQGNVVAGTGSGSAATGAGAASGASNSSASSASSSASSGAADFGSCSTPEIEFGVGFDGRKETSFEPTDKASFNHGSAQNIDIISKFICDTLTNSCKANQAAKDLCTQAQTAADGQTAKTGAQADAFNAVFGTTTNFAAVAAVDDQGNVVAGTGSGSAATGASTASGAAASGANNSAASSSASSGAADFGSCSTPEIEFGVGFDGRKETSFEPADKASFNHGSAQNIDIITQSICDTLTNSCKANQAAKDLCKQAQTAADSKTAKTGAQADAFNAVFGINTNFAAVASVDDQGNVVAGTGSA